jgi:hypothetical protein
MWCCSEMGSYQRSSFPRRRESMDVALQSVNGKAFALTRESLFFACAKKSNQKKAPPGDAPSTLRAAGPQAGQEFSAGTSMCRPRHFNSKLARVVRAARWVYPGPLAASKGARINESKRNARCDLPSPISHSPFSTPGSP